MRSALPRLNCTGLKPRGKRPLTPNAPTATPIADVVTAYIAAIRLRKSAKSAQTDVYYLREVFGPICEALRITSRTIGPKSKKRPVLTASGALRRAKVIEADCFEKIDTSDIVAFINARAQQRKLAPKTLNRYREILHRLFNWAMTQHGVRMPRDKNPVKAVERHPERAPEIRFLSMDQIAAQLEALADDLKMQAMVSVLIYAGLRREELLWLTTDDIEWNAGPHGMLRIRAKTVAGQRWQPKTKRNRAVPISRTLRLYLDKYRLSGIRGTWLFPNSQGGRWDPDNWSSELREINLAKEIVWVEDELSGETDTSKWTDPLTPAKRVPYGCLDFRHTFGSQLASSGVSLQKIAVMMGNSPEICRRHYAAVIPESLVDCVEFGIQQNLNAMNRRVMPA
jgi:integrase